MGILICNLLHTDGVECAREGYSGGGDGDWGGAEGHAVGLSNFLQLAVFRGLVLIQGAPFGHRALREGFGWVMRMGSGSLMPFVSYS